MRGRKPKATILKLLHGNPGGRKLNAAEPQPAPLDKRCPSELIDPVARKEWARAIVPAIAINQITAADRALAIAHCELWASRRSQLLEAGPKNVITNGQQGYLCPNVALTMAGKTLALLLKVDAELGLTPSSRSRVLATPRTAPAAVGDLARARFLGTTQG